MARGTVQRPAGGGNGNAFGDNARFDAYGFWIPEDGHDDEDYRCHEYTQENAGAAERVWQKIFAMWPTVSPGRLRMHTRRGVPDSIRGEYWRRLLGCDSMKEHTGFDYKANLEEIKVILSQRDARDASRRAIAVAEQMAGVLADDSVQMQTIPDPIDDESPTPPTVRQIWLDLDRTLYTHRMFKGEESRGRQSLFNVLVAYARYNPGVGYCQGMSFVASVLLMHMDEEVAFWGLVAMLQRPKYLSGYYDQSLNRVQRHARVYRTLLAQRCPDLAAHLDTIGVHPLMYVTQWFMCLFTSIPCWDTVLAIWDAVILEGITTIFRVTLTIMLLCKEELLAMEKMEQVLPHLHHLPANRMRRSVFLPALARVSVDGPDIEAIAGAIQAGIDDDVLSEAPQCPEPKKRRESIIPSIGIPRRLRMAASTAVTGKEADPKPSALQKFVRSISNPLGSLLKDSSTAINAGIDRVKEQQLLERARQATGQGIAKAIQTTGEHVSRARQATGVQLSRARDATEAHFAARAAKKARRSLGGADECGDENAHPNGQHVRQMQGPKGVAHRRMTLGGFGAVHHPLATLSGNSTPDATPPQQHGKAMRATDNEPKLRVNNTDATASGSIAASEGKKSPREGSGRRRARATLIRIGHVHAGPLFAPHTQEHLSPRRTAAGRPSTPTSRVHSRGATPVGSPLRSPANDYVTQPYTPAGRKGYRAAELLSPFTTPSAKQVRGVSPLTEMSFREFVTPTPHRAHSRRRTAPHSQATEGGRRKQVRMAPADVPVAGPSTPSRLRFEIPGDADVEAAGVVGDVDCAWQGLDAWAAVGAHTDDIELRFMDAL